MINHALVCLFGLLAAPERTVPVAQQSAVSSPTAPIQIEPPLAGPKVTFHAQPLIERGFDGEVTPVDPNPEEAALRYLELDEAEQAATGAILAKRARIIDQFVLGNIELLTQLGVAFGTSDKKDQVNLLLQGAAELRPLFAMGPLQDILREALRPQTAEKFDVMIKDYWDAYTAPKLLVRKPDGKLPNRFEVVTGAKLESLGKEIGSSFQRVLYSGDFVFGLLFKGITLTPDQSMRLHELMNRFMRETKGMPSNDQNTRIFFLVLPQLEESQRPIFLANVGKIAGIYKARQSRPTPPTASAEKPAAPWRNHQSRPQNAD